MALVNNVFTSLLCLLYVGSDIHCSKYVIQLTSSEFTSVKSSPGVNLVYFYKKSSHREKVHQQKQFLEEYEKSAKLIAVYDINFGKVDCPSTGLEEYCDRPEIESHVLVFRNGIELLKLDLDNMFDIDSIVSNVLQLVLLREVPIVQTVKEYSDLVRSQEGQRDMIISYQHAIGTHAHRVYMEVAFAYKSKYKFALTTEKQVVEGLIDFKKDEEAALWFLKSSLATAAGDKDYRMYKYLETMDLMQLARYVKNLDKTLVREASQDETINPFVDLDLHTVFLFCDTETRKQVKKDAQGLVEDFHGLIGVLVVNVDRVDGSPFGFDADRMSLPATAFQYRRQAVFNVMPAGQDTQLFVHNHLSRVSGLARRVAGGGQAFAEAIGGDGGEVEDGQMEEMEDMDGYTPEQSPSEVARQTDIQMVETQDDHVAATVYKLRREKIERSAVPALNDTTFYTEVKDRDLLIVLFYLTFDAPSMAFLRHFSTASVELAKSDVLPFAAVDCFDWTDVCAKVKVNSYPTVRVYRKGRDTRTYKGMLSEEAMLKTALLYLALSPLPLTTTGEVEDFIAGDLPPSVDKHTSVAVIGLFESSHTKELAVFQEAASELEGEFVFGHVTGELAVKIARSHFNTAPPSVVVYRRNDPLKPYSVFIGGLAETEALVKFVKAHSLTSFPELSVTTLPAYLSLNLPLLVLFASSVEEESRQLLGNMAASSESPLEVVYCWMNVTSPTSLAHEVMVEYNPAATPPALSLVDHKQAAVYNYNGIEMRRQKLRVWLTDVLSGKIKPSKMLISKEWKPRHPGYDFLKFIEEDKKKMLNDDSSPHYDAGHLPDEAARSRLREVHADPHTHHQDNRHTDGAGQHTEL